MCYGYHMRLSKEEEMELLKLHKKRLEERMKDIEKMLLDLEKEPAPQSA